MYWLVVCGFENVVEGFYWEFEVKKVGCGGLYGVWCLVGFWLCGEGMVGCGCVSDVVLYVVFVFVEYVNWF